MLKNLKNMDYLKKFKCCLDLILCFTYFRNNNNLLLFKVIINKL